VDAAAAGLLFLLLVRPRLALGAGALFVVSTGALFVALQLASGGTYAANVLLSNTSPFDANQLQAYLLNFGSLHAVVLALAIMGLVGGFPRDAQASRGCPDALAARPRRWTPWVLYFPIAAALALLTVGKTGAGESYFLGTIAAASILAAVEVQRLASGSPARSLLLGGALVVQGLLLAHGAVSDAVDWLPDRGFQAGNLGRAPSDADRRAADQLAALARAAPGPVLAEDASFDVVAGKPIVGTSPPSLRNLYAAGLWDPAPLVADLRAHRYGLVILDAQLYPEPVLAAIGQAYFQERTIRINNATYRVFLPGGG
jgi:hypothetical protein